MTPARGKRATTSAPEGDEERPTQRTRNSNKPKATETPTKKTVKKAPKGAQAVQPVAESLGTKTPKTSRTPRTPQTPKTPPKAEMPPASSTWSFFRDAAAGRFLAAAGENEEFKVALMYFHARMSLVVRGLSLDQLKNILLTTLPGYLQEVPRFERNQAEKHFLDAHDRIEGLLIERIRAYAKAWLESPGGINFRDRQLHAKKQKKGNWPPAPDGNHISKYEGLEGIIFERIQVIDVFLPCMAAVETADCNDAAGTIWLKYNRTDRCVTYLVAWNDKGSVDGLDWSWVWKHWLI